MDVAGLQREQVDLVPGDAEQCLRHRCVDPRALGRGDPAGGVADIVAENAVEQGVGSDALPPLGDGLHGVRFRTTLIGWPLVPARTAWISARIASAISGARAGAEVEADGHPDPGEARLVLAFLAQQVQDGRAPARGAEHADVAHVVPSACVRTGRSYL